MRFILASASPRRRELMEMLGVPGLLVRPAQGEEKADPSLSPPELVCALAAAKAREAAAEAEDGDVVVAADTIVVYGGRVYGKPRTADEAAEMLRTLSGNTHEVYSGVCVVRGGVELCRADRSAVSFRTLSESEIERYIATGEPMDKAGAYGAQGKGALFVERIDGDFFNVMGLPLCLLGEMLKEQGVELL
ncbi:MAG: septum formation inhibitor Maf [Oscillospiraceae bacterium]|nr:septum formation inhibitor Maf [Oscillospiraceae bacterium]